MALPSVNNDISYIVFYGLQKLYFTNTITYRGTYLYQIPG